MVKRDETTPGEEQSGQKYPELQIVYVRLITDIILIVELGTIQTTTSYVIVNENLESNLK